MTTDVPHSIPIKVEKQETEGDEEDTSRLSVMVNYVPGCLTRPDLINLFQPFGELEKMTFFINKVTGVLIGYGFVTYVNTEDAMRCVQSLNGVYILHKRLKVTFARKSSEDIKSTNLYVGRIPLDFTENELQKCFERFGTILSCRILYEKQYVAGELIEVSRGCGFVRFSYNHEAAAALRDGPFDVSYATNGCTNSLAVEILGFKGLALPSPYTQLSKMLYIGNLPEDMTTELLYSLLKTCGGIVNVKLVVDWDTKKCRGYGFARMKNFDGAANAVRQLSELKLKGKLLQVRFKQPN